MSKFRHNRPLDPPARERPGKSLRWAAVCLIAVLAGVLATTWFVSRPATIRVERILESYREDGGYPSLSVLYPSDGTLFPPEIIAPTFRWEDHGKASHAWVVAFEFPDRGRRMSFLSERPEWTPAPDDWHEIKRRSLAQPARITILGVDRGRGNEIVSAARISISTARDEVGAPLFYREVDLPFIQAVRDPAKHIRWRFGSIDSPQQPPVVLEKMPVCANCHSFSRDGQTLGMDVDYANDRGAYIVRPVAREMTLDREQILTWSDYRREDKQPTFGLLSQVSPDGRYVVSTVKDRSVFLPMPDLAFSQLFFPIQGILAIYDRQSKTIRALPGADDPQLVQSNAVWSPDGKYLVFARAKAFHLSKLADKSKILLSEEDCPEFLKEGGTFQFDLYRIPFNGGRGGQAEPLAGASGNGLSNYFARYSPDGKWIVFCRAKSFMLLQPDSELYIIPAEGGEARRLECNTGRMNSWHSWSPNGRWLVFSSKANSPYTQFFLTHIDDAGNSTPPVLLQQFTAADKAGNIPEFVNARPDAIAKIQERFLNEESYVETGGHSAYYGAYEAAIEAYQQALKINPRSAAAYEGWGVALESQGKFDEAQDKLAKSLELDPHRKYAHFHLAKVHAKLGRTAKAIAHYRESLRIDPRDAQTHVSLGVLLEETGDRQQAREHFAEAARIDPQIPLPQVLLGILLVRDGAPQRAEACFRKALQADPDYVDALLQLAWIKADSKQVELRDPQEAITLADRACELTQRQDPGALFVLAVAHHSSGRRAEAVQVAEMALGLARTAGNQPVADAIQKRLTEWLQRP